MAPEEGIKPASEASKTPVLSLNDSGIKWLGRKDLNLQPSRSERGAATLSYYPKMAHGVRFELTLTTF